MKKNEKKTKSDLHKAMRWTQMKFHKAAELSNKREKINAQRSKMIRKKVAADKRHAAAQLKHQMLSRKSGRRTKATSRLVTLPSTLAFKNSVPSKRGTAIPSSARTTTKRLRPRYRTAERSSPLPRPALPTLRRALKQHLKMQKD